MPSNEIKELRQSGKLEEALIMAQTELEADPNNIWAKRNISWVFYDYLKKNEQPEHVEDFLLWLEKFNTLELPKEEEMIFEKLSWQAGKMVFALNKANPNEPDKCIQLFNKIQTFHFPKPSAGYSFMFKAFQKVLKRTDIYIQFADWWDFKNFRPEDYQKDKLPNGQEIMAIAEQAYIAYAKTLLPKQTPFGEIVFDREKAETFLPILSEVAENYPHFQYPAYFQAKLLLALGDKDNILETLLPFAKKKRNDFWVWEILAEAFPNDSEKVFACYCKALSCKSPQEMLVGLRQKMASKLIAKKLYNQAKTEIELLLFIKNENNHKIPSEIIQWQEADWYKTAEAAKSNLNFYVQYVPIAEAILFSDIEEEMVLVEFVNSDKKMLNFIASEEKFGFFKYDRFLKNVKVGDVLKVRFQGGSKEGIHHVYTVFKTTNEVFKNQFVKKISGDVKIPVGKSFGFIEDVYIHPSIINKLKLTDGKPYSGEAIKYYKQEKKQWGWKLILP